MLLSLIMAATAIAGPTTISQTPSVKLAWDASDEPDLAGYRVHLGHESGVYTHIVDVGMGELVVVADGQDSRKTPEPIELPEGGTWFCALTAYNTYGLESDYSNEISFERKVPAPPGGLRVVVSIETSSNLQDWEPIASVEREVTEEEFFRLRFETVGEEEIIKQ